MSSHDRAALLIAALTCITCASVAKAAEITYTFTVNGCSTAGITCATGSLGSTDFSITGSGSDELKFSYVGNTSAVVNWGGGWELLGGTATVSLLSSGGSVLASGTFSTADGMFVSIHNAQNGIGLGSAGVPQGTSGFPGQPIYPVGFFNSALSTYNMQVSLGPLTGGASNCYGNLPVGTCQTDGMPLALTSGGSFVFNNPSQTFSGEAYVGTFSAVVSTATAPEPATLGLIVMGLAGIRVMRGGTRKSNVR